MKNKFLCKLTKKVICPLIMVGFTASAFASSHSHQGAIPSLQQHLNKAVTSGQLRKTLATNQQRQQFSFISKKLIQLRLPKELALIPVIESRYNKGAVSSKGAGGLWQLMPGTAKEFGISSKDRFQLEPSTVAALHYFNVLHKKFGNWEFAIAAYNAGSGRVQKALHRNPSATSVQQLSLPKETKQYVQKFYRMQGEIKSYNS